MAMNITPGRDRPNAPQEAVLACYEQCEDMAWVLTEHAQTLAFKENFSESEVLSLCHQAVGLRNYLCTQLTITALQPAIQGIFLCVATLLHEPFRKR